MMDATATNKITIPGVLSAVTVTVYLTPEEREMTPWLDHNGDPILDHNGDVILVKVRA